jgi:Dolichyl-phosphate-mannose-protein mannosyltransferase
VTSTVAARAGAARPRIAVTAATIAPAALGVLAVVLVAATWGTWGDLDSDTGFDLLAGARVADGDLPYRDFTYYYGPLAPAITGLVSWLAGAGVAPGVAVGLAIVAAIVAATYALARTVVGPLGAFVAAAITVAVAVTPNNYSYVLPHTYAATLGTLGLLVLLLCLARYSRDGRRAWIVAAGTSAGLVALTKPEVTAAALAAAAAWLLVRRSRSGSVRREAALLFGPALLVPGLAYGALLTAVSPHALVFENLWPRDELAAGGDVLLRARMPLTAEGLAQVGGRFLLYAAGAAVLVLVAREIERGGRRRTWLVAGCAVAGLLAVGVAAVKPDGLRDGFYYVWGWIPVGAIVAVAVLLVRFRRGPRAGSTSADIQLPAAVALAILAATCLAFTFHGWRPQMAVYYAPLAAILLVRLHLVELARGRAAYALGVAWVTFAAAGGLYLALNEAGRERMTVRGPGGSLAEAPAEGALYQRALDAIAAHSRPGEPILVTPLMTGLYVVADRTSPLRQISTLPSGLPTRADERAAIARLERADVRLAITDASRRWPGYGHTTFGDSFQRELAGWIEDRFRRVERIGGGSGRRLDVWVRRT